MSFKLVIGVKRGDFRQGNLARDVVFQTIRPKILSRDANTCQACGFRAPKFQHVHHLDDIDTNNQPSNLITLCAFCHATCHIGHSASHSSAKLVYIPELSHDQWSNLLRAIYCCAANKISIPMNDLKQKSAKQSFSFARSILQTALPERAHIAKKKLNGADLLAVANKMKQCSDPQYQQLSRQLNPFKIWHDSALYESEIDHWCATVDWLDSQTAQRIFAAKN